MMNASDASFRLLRRLAIVHLLVTKLGEYFLRLSFNCGGLVLMFHQSLATMAASKIRWKATVEQMYKIGVMSLPLVFLTALFTGIVLSLQSAYQLRLFAAQQFTADLVGLSTVRELGPVLTAMVIAGRVGASIAAELGTMKVTEQVDALRTLAVDPIRYLVVPRFIASVLMLFILTIYADCIGIFGGYMISVFKLGISSHQYITRSMNAMMPKDVLTGLIKAFFFGGIISIVGCYFGFKTSGGAEGVGRSTTTAVVTALILIIAADALFTAIFYFF